ncbi:unnamed protein product [Sphagnum troendelagicum]
MGRKGHAGYSICSHHLVKDTGEKGRYGPTTKMKHRKSSTPAMWRKSTIKVSPCDICASNDAAVRAKHWRAKGRSFSPWELLEACKKVIGSYDRRAAPGETPDAYADVFLPLYNVVHPYDIIFVKQVLFGYCRYRRVVDLVVKRMYSVKSDVVSPEDMLLYKVLAYLAIIRLDELGWREFKLAEIVYAPDPTSRYIPPPTTVIPFNLSVSNYTHPTQEEPEPFVYKAKPAPDWDRGRTLEVKRISAVFKLNRKLLKEKYSDPRYQPFRLRTLERPTNLETIREEVEAKLAAENEYIVTKRLPPLKMPEIEVKLTAATVLREHSRFQKQIDSDKQKIENLELELRDASHLKIYEEELRVQDEIERALDIEFKRATVNASDQAARDAKKKHLCMNWAAASIVKEEKEKTHQEFESLLKNIHFANRFRHHLIKEEAKEVKVVKNKMWNANKEKVREMNAESEDRLAIHALENAREFQCKQELVRQLHFLEKESCYRIPKFDIYSTGNHGCLDEMSIAQLREALFQAKEWGKQEEERKRQDVRAMQEKRQKLLIDTSRVVTRMRQISRAQYLTKKMHEKDKEVKLDMQYLHEDMQHHRYAQQSHT